MIDARGAGTHIAVTGHADRRDVLPGADFVVTCVGVGGRPAWQADHEICMRHGVFQPVGDSVHARRHLPTAAHHAGAGRDRPGRRRTRAAGVLLQLQQPDDRQRDGDGRPRRAPDVVGLCHGMHHIQHHLPAFIGAPFEQTSTLYAGINHLTFIYDFRLRGQDAWPLMRAKVDAELAQPPDPADIGNIFADGTEGVEQPVLLGAVPALRRVSGRRGPARHGVLPGALGAAATTTARCWAWTRSRCRRSWTGARTGTARWSPRPTARQPLDESIFDRSSGEQEQLIAIIRSVLGRHAGDVLLQRGQSMARCPACRMTRRWRSRGWQRPAASARCGCPTCPGRRPRSWRRRLTSVYLAIEAAMTGRPGPGDRGDARRRRGHRPGHRQPADRRPARRTAPVPAALRLTEHRVASGRCDCPSWIWPVSGSA